MNLDRPLPSFDRPPVNEVVCGVTFQPLNGFMVPHVGQLWARFQRDYPICQEAEPLPAIFEPQPSDPLSIRIPVLSFPRVWLISGDDCSVMQIQRDRFLHNWRRSKGTENYPRYPVVIEAFKRRLAEFRSFMHENKLGDVVLTQLELAYINHIPRGHGWETFADLADVFRDFAWQKADRVLSGPEMFAWKTGFNLPDRRGRLHVSIQNALRKQDNQPLIVFELLARGIGADRSEEGIWDWFEVARKAIVLGFEDLTTERARTSVWKRTV